ncbi:MAG: hypothetical protein VX675_05200, partial [Planctomycetota bacterium]|nr:hypothetical protein [Planctomycetota bacterium]
FLLPRRVIENQGANPPGTTMLAHRERMRAPLVQVQLFFPSMKSIFCLPGEFSNPPSIGLHLEDFKFA